jgi:hypothetical protein
VTGIWRKLHNEELNDLYTCPNIINNKQTKKVRRGMHIGFWWESQKERDHSEDQELGGSIIFKWIL